MPEIGEDLSAKRAALLARQAALEIKERKFFKGSRKCTANRQELNRVLRQIAALDRRMGTVSSISTDSSPLPTTGLRKVDLERERFGSGGDVPVRQRPLPPDHKERVAWVLNLEALLEQHRPYTSDWFKLNDMLAEARAALRGDDGA